MNRLIFVLIIIPSGLSGLFAQDSGDSLESESANMQIWLDYNPTFLINNNTRVYGSIGARTIFPHTWDRFYARSAIRYDITRLNKITDRYRTWQLHAGLNVFYTHNLESTDILELRPYQGLRVKMPNFDRFNLIHYIRLEERLEFGIHKKDFEFSIRARYKIGHEIILPGKLLPTGFFIPLYAEFFFNLNRGAQFNDLMRLTPGLGFRPNQTWKFQFDLSYHRTRPASHDRFRTNDIVFRFRVSQVF